MRVVDRKAEILLVRARQHPEHWIFPKGHIEPRESAEKAALRELQEEAGVAASVIAPAGAVEFDSKDFTTRVEYFLCKYQRDVPRQDDRETRWCSYARALELLTFPNVKELLREARARIERVTSRVSK
jgi:diadenosine hexaphosphate hydrolase (ATP-forming)